MKITLIPVMRPIIILIISVILFESIEHIENVSINKNNSPPKLILISFDGFRSDYIDEHFTPNLYHLASSGVRALNMKPSFATKTYPNHMSITTGLYEETHGVIHNKMYDPKLNETFTEFNTDSKWWFSSNSTKPIWIVNQNHNDGKNRISGSVMWPGTDVPYGNNEHPLHLVKYKQHMDFNENMDAAISMLINKTHPANLILMYFDEPDTQAHLYGPFDPRVMSQVKSCDNSIGYLLQKLHSFKLSHLVNVIILSDHGMSEITKDHVIQLNQFIDRSLYEMYGASPVWSIMPKSHVDEDRLYELLKSASLDRNFTVYKRHQIPPEYHYSDNPRILPILIVADDGYDIIDDVINLDHDRDSDKWGNHGYNNSIENMRPVFIASGPNFKENFIMDHAFQNIDVYPLMLMILEMFPLNLYPSNGSLQIISQILKPVVRLSQDTSKDSILIPMISLFMVGFLLMSFCASILVICAGFGKKSLKANSVELSWDPGVTEFDLDTGLNCSNDSRDNNFFNRLHDVAVPESILLLDDLDEDDDDSDDDHHIRYRDTTTATSGQLNDQHNVQIDQRI